MLAEPSGEYWRRRHKRYGRNGEILLRLVVSGPTYAADLFDISCGGCLIWLSRYVPLGLDAVVEVHLATTDLSFRVIGVVRHSEERGRVVGVEFHRPGAQQSEALRRFIASLQATTSPERCWLP